MTSISDAIQNLLWYSLPISGNDQLFSIFELSNTQSFDKEKLEKDFYLTVILHRISKAIPELSFKWGTCLNKVYFPYFRLSEDLDFSLSIQDPLVNSNAKRGKFAQYMREKLKELCNHMGRSLDSDDRHHKKAQGNIFLKNKEYTYLKYTITYPSIYDYKEQTIKIEVTYMNKQYISSDDKEIQAIFIDPILENPIFPKVTIKCLALEEMMAEKIRAALTRQIPVIRDFFDIRHIKKQWFQFHEIRELVLAKVSESENRYTIEESYSKLQEQIKTHLEPVLGGKAKDFDIKEVYKFVLSFKE